MATALAILLDAPAYHSGTAASGGPDTPVWAAAGRSGALPDWHALFDSGVYGSIGEAPACFAWAELASAYPHAKVLLVERQPDQWASSFAGALASVAPYLAQRWWSRAVRDAHAVVTQLVSPHVPGLGRGVAPGRRPVPHDGLVALYGEHYARVKAGVPPHRLAVYRLGDGWSPLCDALGGPFPEGVPFPHSHKGQGDLQVLAVDIRAVQRQRLGQVVATAAAMLAVGVGVWLVWRRE